METKDVFLACVSACLTGSEPDLPDDCDWDALLRLSQEQKLAAAIYAAVRASAPNRAAWRSVAMLDVAHQAQRGAEFLRLYRELSDRGIRPLVVKGILCRETFPEPDARISSDEDLYVPGAEYRRFHETMLALGFRAEEPDIKNAHELRYFRGGLMVEGHWELFPQDNSALNALNALNEGFWTRAGMRDVAGVPMRVLDETDHMTFLLLHLFKHFINSGAGVRQICDIAQWSKTYAVDWQRVRQAMGLAHAEVFAGAVFDAGARYFGMTFPAGWPRADCGALLDDALDAGVYGTSSMSRKHSGSMTLAAVEDQARASGLRSLARTLFPNRAVMETSYPWVRHSAALLPAAWTLRIVKYLGTRGENNSAAESLKIGAERLELMKHYRVI